MVLYKGVFPCTSTHLILQQENFHTKIKIASNKQMQQYLFISCKFDCMFKDFLGIAPIIFKLTAAVLYKIILI